MKTKIFVAVPSLLIVAGITYSVMRSVPAVPSFQKVKDSYQTSDLYLLDRSGEALHQWRQDKTKRSFLWTSLNDVSPALIEAVLKSEDKNFYSHHGVDFPALSASAYQRVTANSPRGGSTLTMQLLKLVSQDKALWSGLGGKFRQIIAASFLEFSWTKNQILEAYLNLVSYRGELQGVESASWALFDKRPAGLTLPEATLLSVLIRSPNATTENWQNRACWQEPALCGEFTSLLESMTMNQSRGLRNQNAYHLAQRLSVSGVKGEVRSTIDKKLQLYVQEVIASQLQQLQERNVNDAAVLVVENRTGEVWTYVGSSGTYSSAPFVDGVQSLRQAGSTLKPFLYATAIEKKLITKNSWIEDSPVDIVFDQGVYKPQNHDRQFYGWVQVRTALASSLNVPAVKVFKLLNDSSFWSKLKDLNFKNLEDPEHYGPALALGVADVSLESLTQAYRTLAEEGMYSSLKFERDGETSPGFRIFSIESSREIYDILSQSQNRALSFGLDSALSLRGTAVKTGTSKDMRDNWSIGMNSRFTVGVWVGNFSGAPMWNVLGVSGAAPIWRKTMVYLQENFPEEATKKQNSMMADADSEPEAYPRPRVIYPQDGMILAIDPAIPERHQQMPLLLEAKVAANLAWKVDGVMRKVTAEPVLWAPRLGRHTFELYQGEELIEKVQVLVK